MTLLYDLALVFIFLLASPKLLFDYFKHKKYRQSIKQRFGFSKTPERSPDDEFVVWVHAISVGEAKAAAALLKHLPSYMKNARIVLSTVTETGQAEAKRCVTGVSDFFYLPLDFSFSIKKCVNRIRPDLVILVEGELWYNWLKFLKKQGASIILVNGKISQKSTTRFAYFPRLSKKLFDFVDFFCLQNEEYKKRFLHLGVPEGKISVTGNLKFDFSSKILSQIEKKEWKEKLGIKEADCVVVIGSTHEDEEKQILDVIKPLWLSIPNLKILAVPRHPERFCEVNELLKQQPVPFSVYSEQDPNIYDKKIILVDAMGILSKCYQIANFAVVCGSFISRVGGHNILEPLEFGVPVFFGPHMHSQQELLKMVLENETGIQVELQELPYRLLQLQEDPISYQSMSANGLALMQQIKGVAGRTWETIRKTSMN